MAGKDTLAVIAEELGLALQPIETALTSDAAFSAFMRQLGWDTATAIAAIKNLGAIVSSILNAVENGLDESQAADVISQIVNFFSAAGQLSSASGLPATIDVAEFQADFPGQLVDFLVARYLLDNHATLGATLLAAGVIRQTAKPAAGKRPAYLRLDIAWNDIGNLLKDGLSTFRGAYNWGGAAFDQQLFLNNMNTLAQAFGLTVFSVPIGGPLKTALTQGATALTNLQNFTLRCQLLGNLVAPADLTAGIDLYALPPTNSAAPGIAFLPYVTGSGGEDFDISDRLSLILKAAFDLAGGILVRIRPNQPVTLDTGVFGGGSGSAAAFSITLQNQGDGGAKQVLLGTEGASRLEYGTLGITIGFRTDTQTTSFYAEAALADAALVITPGADADGFLAKLLPDNINVDASITIGFDSDSASTSAARPGWKSKSRRTSRSAPSKFNRQPSASRPRTATFPSNWAPPSGGESRSSAGSRRRTSASAFRSPSLRTAAISVRSMPGWNSNRPTASASRCQRRRRGRRRISLHRYRPRRIRRRAATGDCRLPLGRCHRPDLHQDAGRLQAASRC